MNPDIKELNSHVYPVSGGEFGYWSGCWNHKFSIGTARPLPLEAALDASREHNMKYHLITNDQPVIATNKNHYPVEEKQ